MAELIAELVKLDPGLLVVVDRLQYHDMQLMLENGWIRGAGPAPRFWSDVDDDYEPGAGDVMAVCL